MHMLDFECVAVFEFRMPVSYGWMSGRCLGRDEKDEWDLRGLSRHLSFPRPRHPNESHRFLRFSAERQSAFVLIRLDLGKSQNASRLL